MPCRLLGFVATIDDLLNSPQYEARGFWLTLEHPVVGQALYPGLPYHLSGIDLPSSPAPLPGAQTGDILRSTLGMSAEEIDHYRAEEVI